MLVLLSYRIGSPSLIGLIRRKEARHALHEEEHISLVIFLWNFCRPVHCDSSALLVICLLELYTFKEGASKPSESEVRKNLEVSL